ncbi:MAG: hypothetical protein J0H54_07235, partial [Rhizobiales bacterium]|nr:hypothetical protein [Hyphomicrobiales bacterium]
MSPAPSAPSGLAAERPAIFARCVGGLGTRLAALVNASALAGALGAPLRFAWPAGADSPGPAAELFAPEFLAAHLIDSSVVTAREILPAVTGLPLDEARRRMARAPTASIVVIDGTVSPPGFSDDSPDAAIARFAEAASAIGWHPALHRIDAAIAALAPYDAIHVRAGDFVSGTRRQLLRIEKYTPRALVELALSRLGADGPVLVVSDNPDYAADLGRRFDFVRRPEEMLSAYGALTTAQQAYADIRLLARGGRTAAPAASAFSRLAGNLARKPHLATHRMLDAEATRSVLRDAIERDLAEPTRPAFRQALLVRDISWYLGVFDDQLPLGERARLADAAASLEPDYCGGLDDAALTRALRGDWFASCAASIRAVGSATESPRQVDAIIDSVATSISADLICQVKRQHPTTATREGSSPLPPLDRVLDRLRRTYAHLRVLRPERLHHRDILFNLRFQIAALDWIGRLDGSARRHALSTLRMASDRPVVAEGWRLDGLQLLDMVEDYPRTLRNIEMQSIRLAIAIGAAVAAFRAEIDDPVGRLDDLEIVLDHDHAVALVDQRMQHLEQLGDVVEVQARR